MDPCRIMDAAGFKTLADIFGYWGAQNNDEQMLANASYVRDRFLDKGILGFQTGQGYHQYPWSGLSGA